MRQWYYEEEEEQEREDTCFELEKKFIEYSGSSDRLELFYASSILEKQWEKTKKRNASIGKIGCGTPSHKLEGENRMRIPISRLDPEYPLNNYNCHCHIPSGHQIQKGYRHWRKYPEI